MAFGLFGKLQAKRDFVAVATPRPFLTVWEPWIQQSISASRLDLRDGWQRAFLTAPIWRFWLGADLCGTTIAGALMPSMDGVGRYFPLTVIHCADDGRALPPPELDACDAWYSRLEDFLFGTLEEGRAFEATLAALEALPEPAPDDPGAGSDLTLLPAGAAIRVGEGGFSGAFAAARRAAHPSAYAASTFWWTAGGEGYGRLALSALRMPDPYLMTGMITGRFEPRLPP